MSSSQSIIFGRQSELAKLLAELSELGADQSYEFSLWNSAHETAFRPFPSLFALLVYAEQVT